MPKSRRGESPGWSFGSSSGALRGSGSARRLAAARAFWVGLALARLVDAVSGAAGGPRLTSLGLRCADRPLDLHPPFSPSHFVYGARLDFAEGSFSVDVTPASGAAVPDLEDLSVATMIPPGGKHNVVVKVQEYQGNASMDYTISVLRLDGRDVALRAVEIESASISPLFTPERASYLATVPAEVDRLSVHFVPWDTGQQFEVLALESDADFEAAEEWTTTTFATAFPTTTPAFDGFAEPLPEVLWPSGGPGAGATVPAPRAGAVATTTFAPTTTTTTRGAVTSTTAASTPAPATTTSTAAGPHSFVIGPQDMDILRQTIQCFDSGISYGPLPDMLGQVQSQEPNAAACQGRCLTTPRCTYFTYWPDGRCHVQDASAIAQNAMKGDVVSGPPSCKAPCFAKNMYYGPSPNMIGQAKSVEPSALACQARCVATSECAHFSYWPDGGCHLQDVSATQVATHEATLAGPKQCRTARRLSRGTALGVAGVVQRGRARWRRLDDGSPPAGSGGGGTFLSASGESQQEVVERNFLFEVGQTRLLVINVRAANGDATLNRTYMFEVTRQPCPPSRPYFAPDASICAVTCSKGFFPNGAALRCERCPMHCRECTDWDRCLECEPTHLKTLHIINLVGSRCRELQLPWRRILQAVVGGIGGLSLLCCCCCCGLASAERRRAVVEPKFGGAFRRRGRAAGGDGPETDRLLDGTASDDD